MAETTGTEGQGDLSQVQDFIKSQVETYFTELASKQQQTPAQQASEQELAQRQLQQTLDPFITPGINEAKLTAADAKDYVDFYTGEADAAVYREQVESTFKQLQKEGRATNRATILRYLQGDEYRKDPDAFIAKQSAQRKQQLERASEAGDIGAGAGSRNKQDELFKNFNSKTVEEMEQALEGVAF